MASLELLRPDHGRALLAFELENRAYFAESVPDRGDDYFAHFDERLAALLEEQLAGVCYFHVLVDEDKDEVLGRFNLVDVADGSAELGFRLAKQATGHGLATAAVLEICTLAAGYGLTSLRAAATVANTASRAVLSRTGFLPTGQTRLDGQPALTFTRAL